MDENIVAVLIGAVSAGLFSSIGWFVNHQLAKQKEYESQRRTASIEYIERQIEELFGPILGHIRDSAFVLEVAKRILPIADDKHFNYGKFTDRDFEIYDYFVKNYFIPNNAKIANLLNTKLTLLEVDDFPASFQQFLKHQAQYECLYKLMEMEKIKRVESTSIAFDDYPSGFDQDIENYLQKYRKKYVDYLNKATAI